MSEAKFYRTKGGAILPMERPREENQASIFDGKIESGELVELPAELVEQYHVQVAVDAKTSKPIMATRYKVKGTDPEASTGPQVDGTDGAGDDGADDSKPDVLALKARLKELGVSGYSKWDATRLQAEVAAAEAEAAAAAAGGSD